MFSFDKATTPPGLHAPTATCTQQGIKKRRAAVCVELREGNLSSVYHVLKIRINVREICYNDSKRNHNNNDNGKNNGNDNDLIMKKQLHNIKILSWLTTLHI